MFIIQNMQRGLKNWVKKYLENCYSKVWKPSSRWSSLAGKASSCDSPRACKGRIVYSVAFNKSFGIQLMLPASKKQKQQQFFKKKSILPQ